MTRRRDELENEFGFPVPVVEAELRGVSDISSLRGVLPWGGSPTSMMPGSTPGPITRSRASGVRTTFPSSVKATAALSRGKLACSLLNSFRLSMC